MHIRFIDDEQTGQKFHRVLRERVDAYFKENNISKYGNSTIVIKSVVLMICYLFPFILMLTTSLPIYVHYILWCVMGFALAGIGMSVMHDANHGAYSSNKVINFLMGHSLNLLGGCVSNWKIQHNVLHHSFTNIAHVDDDIDDKLFFRFSPHGKSKWILRFQYIYCFFFYGLTTLYWAVGKDFVQFFLYSKEQHLRVSGMKKLMAFLQILLYKIIYFMVILIIPIFVLGMNGTHFFLGWIIMQFIAGITLTVVFQLAHVVETTEQPLPDDKGVIHDAWVVHQLKTTCNFSRSNKWLSWYVGGLNFQVEHHIFPNICHVHYPKIAPIVKQTAEEFGAPYLEYDTFGEALSSHLKTMRRFGHD
ncbi:MAG: acyl-CoA desaturase [Flavobacteriales bacterium]|nr:acyl-CoA desaturase [Flavobacteriales bacterium]